MAVVLEKVVQSNGHRIRIVADDGEFPAALFQPEEVALPFRLLEDEMAGLLRPHDARGQGLRGLHLRVRRTLRSAGSRREEDGGCEQ